MWVMKLQISRTQRQQLLDWAREAYPNECCGLLLGKAGKVEQVKLTQNMASAPLGEFEIDPSALIAAERSARQGGPAILGYFHSHPNGAEEPSPKDTDMAADDGRKWVIIAGGNITCWTPVSGGKGDRVSFESEGFVQG